MGDHSEIVAGRPAEQKQLIHASQTAVYKTLSASKSPVSLCNVTGREKKRRVGLCIWSKFEFILFRSMWETCFCLHFQSRYGNLNSLQSFWYTLYLFVCVCYRRYLATALFTEPSLSIWFIRHNTVCSFNEYGPMVLISHHLSTNSQRRAAFNL
jgi:hypothetical protein